MKVAGEHRLEAQLERERGFVEYLVGRSLRYSEQIVDVLRLDQALNDAKDEIERQIRKQMVKAAERALVFDMMPVIDLTAEMLAPLEKLFRLGQREARRELVRLGVKPRKSRQYVAEPRYPELDPLAETVKIGLNGLGVRVHNHLLEADLGDASFDAIARALLDVPGARWIAAEVISRALTTGLQATFEQNQDLVGGWEYSSVLDGGTCDPCGSLDGTTYRNLDELFVDLPGFGPYPGCDGGGRCRCRGVPLGPSG